MGQNTPMSATYLQVPFRDKDSAKALGARWDPAQRQWYVPAGRELAPFAAWLPAGLVEASPPLSPGSAAASVAFAALVWLFCVTDLSVALVAKNSHSVKPLLYKFAGAWGKIGRAHV